MSIVVLGSSNTDMILRMKRIPRPGETILGGEFAMAAGGKGANQAVAAARAGGKVVFVSKVGDDLFGERSVEGYKKDGVDVSYIFKDKNLASGVALIFVEETGENAIGVASGANMALTAEEIRRAKPALESADVLLAQLETPLDAFAEALALKGEKTRAILNPAPAAPIPDEILAKLYLITPNETEVETLTGVVVENEEHAARAAQALMAKGVENVAITMGAKGAFLANTDGNETIPSFRVEAADTTAAGDVFNGALATALTEGKNLREATRFAAAAAARSVTKLGAQPSVPRREEIDALMNGE
ncbi:MAG: ribokinase [Ignavibacteriales bacterium]|nr:ribokinase [Ignavibacteriales bacterium]